MRCYYVYFQKGAKTMKKISAVLMLLSIMFILNTTPVSADSNYLTETQKKYLIKVGYPLEFKYQLDDWYHEIQQYDSFGYGFYTHYDMMCNFVYHMREATNPNNVSDFAKVARGVYDEISDVYDTPIESMNGIWDSLTNRVESGYSVWSNYYKAASNYGLNSLNRNMNEYWLSSSIRKPLVDACKTGQKAKKALVRAYTISFRKFGYGANPRPTNFRFTNLKSGYFYFVERNRKLKDDEIKIGAFYHSKTN